ncbi:hypothetical protein C1646_633800, partial [Rhizophagus diaphanus]
RAIKSNEKDIILPNFHENPLAGHFGFNETFRAIKKKYFWLQMGDDIKSYVQSIMRYLPTKITTMENGTSTPD